jgi:sulfur-carrier protein adenylyltransferase/sulfurtransferase
MNILNFFKPVSSWPAGRVIEFLAENDLKEYNLVDVRTPEEYQERHLPGSRLIPLGEIEKRLNEIDPKKPTIIY